MSFSGRSRELGHLRALLDGREASLVTVTGLRGVGKSALVERAVTSFTPVLFRAPPLPEPEQRRRLALVLAAARAERGLPAYAPSSAPEWSEIFSAVLALADPDRPPLVLVMDDAERLTESRARYLEPLLATLRAARAQGRPLHAVLVGGGGGVPEESGLGVLSGGEVRLSPLPFRAARALLPGSEPTDLLRAYGLLGGIPAVLRAVDPSVTLETNIRRLMLDAGARLADAGGRWLERDLQAPARYYAIVQALAAGEAAWGPVHAGVADLTASGQVAPYLRRLEQLGLIEVRSSLDAGPRSRSRRYRIADPFLASWFRFVLPRTWGQGPADAGEYLATVVRPALDAHMARVFPELCRQYVSYDAADLLGTNARDAGSLWGPGYEIPVAGMLASGAAYYGVCSWSPFQRSDEPLGTLDAEIRETRYGFGRERRLRLVFTGRAAPQWLQREVARREDAALIDARALVEVG
jgi:hypothetical protein